MLVYILRCVGIKEALAALPHNRQLHQAWQQAVQHVELALASTMCTDDDIRAVCKISQLESLTLETNGQVPRVCPLHVLAVAAQALQLLQRVYIEAPGCFAVPKASADLLAPLAARLVELSLEDDQMVVGLPELRGLARFSSLARLSLMCRSISAADAELEPLRKAICSLRALQHLELDMHTQASADEPQPALLAVFPGSLTGLTQLELSVGWPREWTAEQLDRQRQQLAAAVSSLVNLQSLTADYPLAPQVQQLEQLTYLEVYGEGGPDSGSSDWIKRDSQLTMLAALPQLQVLRAPCHVVHNPFSHPSLTELVAGDISSSSSSTDQQGNRGSTGQDSHIQRFELHTAKPDSSMAQVPYLPRLQFLDARVEPTVGRHPQLAALLQRQAAGLRELKLIFRAPFKEQLPRELPVCTRLEVLGGPPFSPPMTRSTLALLGMASMPRMQQLKLTVGADVLQPADAVLMRADLGWLRGLPELAKVTIEIQRSRGRAVSDPAVLQAALAALQQLLEGTGAAAHVV